MVGDPNWLYSTIAQSSAAIVAIVGGFITASVLMLLAEKRTLTNQRIEKKAKLESLNKTYDTMTKGNKAYTKSDGYRIEDLRREIAIIESEVANLDARLKTFSYPPNLGWSIIVLGYLALFSILLPVLLIYEQVYINIARILAMAAFYMGIIALCAYVFFLISALRRK